MLSKVDYITDVTKAVKAVGGLAKSKSYPVASHQQQAPPPVQQKGVYEETKVKKLWRRSDRIKGLHTKIVYMLRIIVPSKENFRSDPNLFKLA